MHARSRPLAIVITSLTLFLAAQLSVAQVGYGVNAGGELFRFNTSVRTTPVVPIGNLGFVPEGIDFRPGSDTLYAIDVGAAATQLYTVNITTGASTPVGPAFPSVGTIGGGSYNLATATSFGFDFNPTTLQPDGSLRIRLVSNTGQNFRIDSDSGQIAAVDAALNYPAGGTPNVDAIAYSKSADATASGATVLYGLDFGTDSLVRLNSPDDGILTRIGSIANGTNIIQSAHLEIFSRSTDAPGNPGVAHAIVRVTDASQPWMMFAVNLTTGALTLGSPVGTSGGNPPADFTGGFALVLPAPTTAAALATLAGPLLLRRRRQRG